MRRFFVLAAAMIAAGCSSEDVSKQFSALQNQVGQVTDQLTGKIELNLPTKVNLPAAYARRIPSGEGRPAVVQISSYRRPSEETFPSVFLQLELPADAAAHWVGKKVPGRLFVALEPEFSAWESPWLQQAEFEITAVDEWSVTCGVKGTPMECAFPAGKAVVDGTLIGVFSAEDSQ